MTFSTPESQPRNRLGVLAGQQHRPRLHSVKCQRVIDEPNFAAAGALVKGNRASVSGPLPLLSAQAAHE